MSNPITAVSPTVESPTNPGSTTGRTFESWAEALATFNRMFIYVRNPGVVVRRSDLAVFNPASFAAHQYSNWHYMRVVESDKGESKEKRVSLAQMWRDSSERNECEHMTYAPGYRLDDPGNENKQMKINRKPTRHWIVALPEKIEALKLHEEKPAAEWVRLYDEQFGLSFVKAR